MENESKPSAAPPATPSLPPPPPGGRIDFDPPPANEGVGGAFGRILIERGLATEEDLERCLTIQQNRAKRGDFVRLGAILVEEGILTPPQVAEVLQQQAITVLACEGCGAQYNVRRFSPLKTYECRRCHGKLVQPTGKLEDVRVQDAVEEPKAGAVRTDQTRRVHEGTTVPVPAIPQSTGTGRIRQARMLGRYEILGEIARGGMGVIYKGRQLDLDRVVALKTLRADESRRDDSHERFRREARAVAQLRHPNIVAVHEVGEFEGIPYFTMEFIEGMPLDRRILRAPMPPKEAIELLAPVCEALHYCHTEGVVHRDLKPANVIVDPKGVPFLVDFGIAVRKSERGPELDDKDELLGSIPYMAPEYVEGSAYDERCDIYSFGVLLYEVLSGHEKFPFFDRSTTRLLEKITHEDPVPLLERVPTLDPDLAAVVMKALTRPREQRYATAGALASDLRAWLRGDPVTARPKAPFTIALENLRKQATPLLALALSVFAVMLAVIASGRAHEVERLSRELEAKKGEVEAATLDRDVGVCRALFESARVCIELGDKARAVTVLDDAVRRFGTRERAIPVLADVFHLRGEIRTQLGDKAGEEDLQKAAKLDPRFAR